MKPTWSARQIQFLSRHSATTMSSFKLDRSCIAGCVCVCVCTVGGRHTQVQLRRLHRRWSSSWNPRLGEAATEGHGHRPSWRALGQQLRRRLSTAPWAGPVPHGGLFSAFTQAVKRLFCARSDRHTILAAQTHDPATTTHKEGILRVHPFGAWFQSVQPAAARCSASDEAALVAPLLRPPAPAPPLDSRWQLRVAITL